jgi:cell shape-determining protein MreD
VSARQWLWLAAIVTVSALVQASWLPRRGGEWPDAALVVVILVALRLGAEAGLVAGLLASLLTGWLAGAAMSAFVLSRLATALVVSALARVWHIENLLAQGAAVLIGGLLTELVFAIACPAVLAMPDWWPRVVTRAGLNLLAALLLAPLVATLPRPKERWDR